MKLPVVASIAGGDGRLPWQSPEIYVDVANIKCILALSTLGGRAWRGPKEKEFPMKLQIVELIFRAKAGITRVPRLLAASTLIVAFTAGTLQGSRLPESPHVEGERMAAADSRLAYRAGSGADPEDFPPRSEGVQA